MRLLEYQKARKRIFGDFNFSCRSKRSSARIRNFYKRLKSLKSVTISPIISPDDDSRPYINLKIGSDRHLALLDSGANRSVIGGALTSEVMTKDKGRIF